MERYTLALERQAGRLVARVAGELDIATVPPFMAALQALIDDGVIDMDLDVDGLTFCDSSCLRGLITLHEALLAAGGRLTLVSPGTQMKKLLEVTSLTEHFHIRWPPPGTAPDDPATHG